jgi:hypothetical protein
LGIELAKTLSLNYSNQETSVTIGESVRDEDGTSLPPNLVDGDGFADFGLKSVHPPIHRPGRDQ